MFLREGCYRLAWRTEDGCASSGTFLKLIAMPGCSLPGFMFNSAIGNRIELSDANWERADLP